MGIATFNYDHKKAWESVGLGTKNKPAEIFPKFSRRNFEDLKTDYNNKYGYTVRIPQWDDIVHLTPTLLKDPQVIKAEKKEALVRILESPAPEWARKYASAMTWIDNVQDTSSIVIPLVSMAARVFPKAMSKVMPVFGWIMLGYDLLNFLNAIGRAPLTGMKSKRSVCMFVRQNPFTKTANLQREGRIRNYNPGLGDLIQVAQVTDQYTGFGLSLGGIMGAITDSIIGAYRYLNGEPVRWSFDPPPVDTLSMMGARGTQAAAAISSQGQTFSDLTHFWTYVTGTLSAMALGQEFLDYEMTDMVENPTEMMIPAPIPTDPYTIAAIQDMGLKVEDGVGWPYNGEKNISVKDYIQATAGPSNDNFHAYCRRHEKDWYGYVAAMMMDTNIPVTLMSMDPDNTYQVDDTVQMKVAWKMIKAPLLPTGTYTKEQSEKFWSWVDDCFWIYHKEPGIQEIAEKFNILGIKYITSYPATPQPGFEDFWSEGWKGDESI